MTPEQTHHQRLVLAVNELFHDLEGEDYNDVHPEIFEREKMRWQRLLGVHALIGDHPKTVLDLGSGTGFVGEQMTEAVKSGDTFLCADLSAKMLEIATKNLQGRYPGVTVKGVKLTDESLPLPNASVDTVTMNSVLHHIPDHIKFLQEINRVMKPGGTLFIGHEPNIRFIRQPLLSSQASLLHALNPKRLLARALRFFGILKPLKTGGSDVLTDAINAALLEKKMISKPLTRSEISQLVDVHSPTAGGIHREEGFDPWTVLNDAGISMKPVHVETYNHLGKWSGLQPYLRPYEKFLAMIAPKSGAMFFLVAKK